MPTMIRCHFIMGINIFNYLYNFKFFYILYDVLWRQSVDNGFCEISFVIID